MNFDPVAGLASTSVVVTSDREKPPSSRPRRMKEIAVRDNEVASSTRVFRSDRAPGAYNDGSARSSAFEHLAVARLVSERENARRDGAARYMSARNRDQSRSSPIRGRGEDGSLVADTETLRAAKETHMSSSFLRYRGARGKPNRYALARRRITDNYITGATGGCVFSIDNRPIRCHYRRAWRIQFSFLSGKRGSNRCNNVFSPSRARYRYDGEWESDLPLYKKKKAGKKNRRKRRGYASRNARRIIRLSFYSAL